MKCKKCKEATRARRGQRIAEEIVRLESKMGDTACTVERYLAECSISDLKDILEETKREYAAKSIGPVDRAAQHKALTGQE